jgi:hypothetical protein
VPVNRSKAIGTKWESAVVAYLNARGWVHAERRTLSGNLDRGDINLGNGAPVVIECKHHNRLELAAWLDEAADEAANAHVPLGVVWAHRKGKASPADGYVVMSGEAFATLLRDAGY